MKKVIWDKLISFGLLSIFMEKKRNLDLEAEEIACSVLGLSNFEEVVDREFSKGFVSRISSEKYSSLYRDLRLKAGKFYTESEWKDRIENYSNSIRL